MKVYIVEIGCYEGRSIAGVYDSLETALAAHPVPREGRRGGHASAERPGGWQCRDGLWENGLDWDEAASICEYDVESLPVAAPA